MSELKKIVKRGAKKLRWKDGSALVDSTTANAVLAVHKALSPANKKIFSEKANKSLVWFNKLASFAFKRVTFK